MPNAILSSARVYFVAVKGLGAIGDNVVLLLCGERRVKNIVFTSGDGKNHEWRMPRVVFGVPTSENNVFALLKQAQ
jgi:hypothetical protein